jgi:hypothetical protein
MESPDLSQQALAALEKVDALQRELTVARERIDWLIGNVTEEGFSYGGALIRLQEGDLLRRRSWAAYQHVRLITGKQYNLLPQFGREGIQLPTTHRHHPWLAQQGSDLLYSPWAPNVADQLARDWEITRS